MTRPTSPAVRSLLIGQEGKEDTITSKTVNFFNYFTKTRGLSVHLIFVFSHHLLFQPLETCHFSSKIHFGHLSIWPSPIEIDQVSMSSKLPGQQSATVQVWSTEWRTQMQTHRHIGRQVEESDFTGRWWPVDRLSYSNLNIRRTSPVGKCWQADKKQAADQKIRVQADEQVTETGSRAQWEPGNIDITDEVTVSRWYGTGVALCENEGQMCWSVICVGGDWEGRKVWGHLVVWHGMESFLEILSRGEVRMAEGKLKDRETKCVVVRVANLSPGR